MPVLGISKRAQHGALLTGHAANASRPFRRGAASPAPMLGCRGSIPLWTRSAPAAGLAAAEGLAWHWVADRGVSGGGVWRVRLLGGEDGQYVAAEDRDAADQYGQFAIIEAARQHGRVAGAGNARFGEGDRHDVDENPGGMHFIALAAQRARR